MMVGYVLMAKQSSSWLSSSLLLLVSPTPTIPIADELEEEKRREGDGDVTSKSSEKS